MANLAKNQESLERVVEDKIHGLDVKITEVKTIVDSLRKEVDDAKKARRRRMKMTVMMAKVYLQ